MKEIRCMVCGGMMGVIDMMFYRDTCSAECFETYYTNPDDNMTANHEDAARMQKDLEEKINWLWQYGVESPTARQYFQNVVDALRHAEIKASAPLAPPVGEVTPEKLAQMFHEAYERLAPSFGYETRKASAKPWADVPENNKSLMIAVCREILAAPEQAEGEVAEAWRRVKKDIRGLCNCGKEDDPCSLCRDFKTLNTIFIGAK